MVAARRRVTAYIIPGKAPQVPPAAPTGAEFLAVEEGVARTDPGPVSTDGRVLAFGPSGEPKSPLTAVYAENHNVVWDGTTDTTAALDTALAMAVSLQVPLILPPGVGMVTTWAPPDDSTIQGPGSGACIIRQHPSATGSATVTMTLADRSNISLSGFTVDGNKSAFAAVSTEHKHAIDCRGVSNLTMNDVWAVNPKGDGLYFGVGTTGTTSHIRLTNVGTDGAHRNGCSIISMDDGVFTGCSFLNSSGTNPQAGLDIEPNYSSELIRNLRFIGCTIEGNAHEGVIVTLKPSGTVRQGQIRFVGCAVRDNGWYGVHLYRCDDASFTDCDVSGNAYDGYYVSHGTHRDITIKGGSIKGNGRNGINVSLNALPNIQTVTVTGTPTGGTFTLTFDGQTTAGIAYNATKEQVGAALEALSNVAPGDLTLMDGPLPTRPVTITFKGAWAGIAAPLMTANSAGLTGGTSPTATPTQLRGSLYNFRVESVNIEDNSQSAANTYDGIALAAVDTLGEIEHPRIVGVRSGNVQGSTQRRGLTVDDARTKLLNIIDNDFRGNAGSAALLNDTASGRVARNNLGLSTVTTFAAAGTVTNIAEIINVAPTAPFTLTLPADPMGLDQGHTYTIFNSNGQAGTHNVTVAANTGHTLRNSGGSLVIGSNFGQATVGWRGNNWIVVSEVP